MQSITYKNIKFEEQQNLLGLKNIICKNGSIKFLGDNGIPMNPHFKTIMNILSTAVDTANCTADVYIGGKIIL